MPSGRSSNLSQAFASQRDPSPAQSTISVSSTGSRVAPRPNPCVLPHPPPHAAARLPSRRLAPVILSFQLAMSSSPLSVASSVPSSPSFRDGCGDLPELLRFGDQPASPPWDSDVEKCLSEVASPLPPLPTPPSSPPPPSRAPTSPSPLPRPHSTPYQVAVEAVEEALMCTAVPPPSPPPPTPQVRTQGPPHPLQTHCSRALQCQNTAAHPGESRGVGFRNS